MKRLLALAPFIAAFIGIIGVPAAADAAAARHTTTIAAVAGRQLLSAPSSSWTHSAHVAHRVYAHTRTKQDATSLRVPNSAFSPATVSTSAGYDNTVDPATAQKDTFASFHGSTYAKLGMASGYFQVATWAPDSSGTLYVIYQGSIFSSATTAAAALTDARTYNSGLGDTVQDCSATYGTACLYLSYSTQSGGTGRYQILQYNQCLIEDAVAGPTATAQTYQSQTDTTEDTVVRTALAAIKAACGTTPPTGTPTPTTGKSHFTMLAARVETQSAKFDWNLVQPAMSQLRGGAKVRLTIYWHVDSAPANLPYHALFLLSRGSQTVETSTFDGTVGTKPVETWATWWKGTLPKTSGDYRLTGQITLNGHTKSTAIEFHVAAHAPAKVEKVSFHLTSVQLLNAHLKKLGALKPGEKFFVRAAWSVQHLHRSQRAVIVVAFADPGSHRAIFTPKQTVTDTGNGTHFNDASFLVPRQSVLVVVGVTMGGKTLKHQALLKVG